MPEHVSDKGGARVRIPPPAVFVALIGVGAALRYLVAPPPLPGPRALQLFVAALAAGAAVALGAWAFTGLKKTGQDPAPWRPVPELVVRGPYRFTRNPIYVAMTTLQIGVGVLLGNLWIVLLAVVGIGIVHYAVVLPEERFLDEKFGDSYRAYKNKVRRYL
jgi:protein-S-isoprenylcysteine O-methyltransferase Ste14